MSKTKTILSWSSGKDASLALYYLGQSEKYEISHLLTSVNAHHDRVSMHGLRRNLLLKQIRSLDLPHTLVELSESPSMQEYEDKLNGELKRLRKDGLNHIAFGDIFLEDLRTYRTNQMKKIGIDCLFPIWKKDSGQLFKEFISLNFKAIVIAANSELSDFVGRILDLSFLEDLPNHVDPCGENGEFHTFCFDGPIFNYPIEYDIGKKIYREYSDPNEKGKKVGFWFCDLIPKD